MEESAQALGEGVRDHGGTANGEPLKSCPIWMAMNNCILFFKTAFITFA